MAEQVHEKVQETLPWAQQVVDAVAKLIGTSVITWGFNDNWRSQHAVALTDLTLASTKGDQPAKVGKGRTLWLPDGPDPTASGIRVRDRADGSFEADVPSGSVEIRETGGTAPDHELEPITLLCFELFPYVAMHAELMTPGMFFSGIAARRAYDGGGSSPWASFFGGNLASQPQIRDFKKAAFAPGDLIIFFDQFDVDIHTAIASGKTDPEAGPMVYSISDTSDLRPVCWSLRRVADSFKGQWPEYVKAFTPRPPKS